MIAEVNDVAGKDKSNVDVYPGRAFPLGATWDGKGVNFSIYCEHLMHAPSPEQ